MKNTILYTQLQYLLVCIFIRTQRNYADTFRAFLIAEWYTVKYLDHSLIDKPEFLFL